MLDLTRHSPSPPLFHFPFGPRGSTVSGRHRYRRIMVILPSPFNQRVRQSHAVTDPLSYFPSDHAGRGCRGDNSLVHQPELLPTLPAHPPALDRCIQFRVAEGCVSTSTHLFHVC